MYLGYSVLEFTAKYSVESSPEEERTKLISEVAVKCLRFMRRIDVVFQILIYAMVSVTVICFSYSETAIPYTKDQTFFEATLCDISCMFPNQD